MKLSNSGTVPVYTISGASTSRSLPDWLSRKKKRSLKNDPEYANRVELLQDFEFEEASTCVRVSEDGDWAMSTGTYKPQIHSHHLPSLSMSYSRHTTSLNQTFVILSSDASKSLHLQNDRRLELHTMAGCHYHVRLPRFGRDLAYDRHSTEALIPATGLDGEGKAEVFRLNLELGRFMKSYQVDCGADDGIDRGLQGSIGVGSVNTVALAENTHNLSAFGTSIGTVEFWDPRSKSRIATLGGHDGEVTALEFSPSGLHLATGSSTGMIQRYDLRRPVPLLKKDHGYGFPIKNLIHMTTSSQEKKILSADKHIIKIWDESSGDPWTSIETVVDINHVAWCKGTGMLFAANEGQQMHAWLIPHLGNSPRWCSFLDNLVEEMTEEVHTETYDDYKFLTLPELKSLSMAHLIGKTNLLRPYMHGYFVASKLYDQARLIANPYMYEEERMKRVKEKVEKERASRIRGSKKVKVNQKFVDKLLKKQEKRDKVDEEAGVLGDERFKGLFEDQEFAIDEHSREFRALNPSTVVTAAGDDGAREASSDDSDGESDDDNGGKPVRSADRDGVQMRVSSSAHQGKRINDTALGSRVPKTRVEKNRGGNSVGEKSVTFMPPAKKKQEKEQVAIRPKPFGSRRSASANTFRKL
ncbi:hypothetical protein RB595_003104 [Gaeumannomyces hyphopodioides]